MSRWIDGDWLLNFFEPYPDDYQTPLGTLRACVDDAPSIDIVRCKECKKAHLTYDGTCKYCDEWKDDDDNYIEVYHDGDHFCSYGEREGE
jgi:hypothetical protein